MEEYDWIEDTDDVELLREALKSQRQFIHLLQAQIRQLNQSILNQGDMMVKLTKMAKNGYERCTLCTEYIDDSPFFIGNNMYCHRCYDEIEG